MIGKTMLRTAVWVAARLARPVTRPLGKAYHRAAKVADVLYYDVVKMGEGQVDVSLRGALIILKDCPPGTTRFLTAEPTIEDIISEIKVAGFGFVVFQDHNGRFRVKRVEQRLIFSRSEWLLGADRMKVFVSCYRQQLPALPNHADFYWVRGGGRGIIFSADKTEPKSTVVFFKSPEIEDSTVPFFKVEIPQEEIGLTLTAFVERHTLSPRGQAQT